MSAPRTPKVLDEHDLANEMKGNNKLQGQDQSRVRNQRLTQPGSLDERDQPPTDMLPDDGDDGEAATGAASPGGGERRNAR